MAHQWRWARRNAAIYIDKCVRLMMCVLVCAKKIIWSIQLRNLFDRFGCAAKACTEAEKLVEKDPRRVHRAVSAAPLQNCHKSKPIWKKIYVVMHFGSASCNLTPMQMNGGCQKNVNEKEPPQICNNDTHWRSEDETGPELKRKTIFCSFRSKLIVKL